MTKEFLYLLECENYYKIGISNNPKLRFTAIRTANPFEVIPVMCIFGYDKKIIRGIETKLHYKFKHIKHRNEWFIKSDEIISQIKSLIDNEKFFEYSDFVKDYYGIASSELRRKDFMPKYLKLI